MNRPRHPIDRTLKNVMRSTTCRNCGKSFTARTRKKHYPINATIFCKK